MNLPIDHRTWNYLQAFYWNGRSLILNSKTEYVFKSALRDGELDKILRGIQSNGCLSPKWPEPPEGVPLDFMYLATEARRFVLLTIFDRALYNETKRICRRGKDHPEMIYKDLKAAIEAILAG